MTMPNFLLIGAPKAGTTALYYYLKQHPEVYLPDLKEPHFFSYEGEKLSFRGPGNRRDLPFNDLAVTNLADYQALFTGVTNEIAIGEASPSYIHTPKAVERIKYYLPDVKLMAILRNPVDRAYSAFLHQYLSNDLLQTEKLTNFLAAFEADAQYIKENWMPLYYLKTGGLYYQHLARYYQELSAKQIKIFLHQDFQTNPNKLMQECFSFLEVNKNFIPDMSVRANMSGVPKNLGLFRFLRSPSVKRVLKPFLPKGIGQKFDKFMLQKPTILPEIRQKIINVYRDDILQLQDLIDRDLSAWLIE